MTVRYVLAGLGVELAVMAGLFGGLLFASGVVMVLMNLEVLNPLFYFVVELAKWLAN